MKFFITTIYCRSRILFNKSFIIALAIFLLVSFFISSVFSDGERLRIKIGICSNTGEFAEKLEERFKFYAGDNILLIKYSNLNSMKKDIASSKLECGYALPSSSTEKINLFISEYTVSEEVSNILLASALFENMAGELGYTVVKNYINAKPEVVVNSINQKNETYLRQGSFMNLNYMSMKQATIEPIVSGNNNQAVEVSNQFHLIMSGTAALFVMLISFLGAANLVSEKNNLLQIRLAGIVNLYYLGNITAFSIVGMLIFTISQCFIGFYSPIANFTYSLAVSVFSIFLAILAKNEEIIIFICIIMFLACCIFGGVFFSISEFFPSLDWIKYFTTTYYYMEML